MTSKILTDGDGDTLYICPWPSGRVVLFTRQVGKRAEFGPVEPADLIAAIREVAGEKDEPAEDSISRAELDARLARRDEAHKRQVTRMQRQIETLQSLLALRRKQMNEMRDQMAAMTPAPTTPRELLAMLPGLCYEPEGDVIPADTGHVLVWDDGDITVSSGGYPYAPPAVIGGGRRLLLDPPAPKRPEWADADWVWADTENGKRVIWKRLSDDPVDHWWTWADRTLSLDEMAERRPAPVTREEVEV